MADELVSALLKDANLKVVLATTTGLSRHAREIHQAFGAASEVMSQGLTGALLLASLQKEATRVNLQLACDGPLGGFFADAGSDGTVRGYVKNPIVAMHGQEGLYKWRPVFGNSGFLSVLRDLGGGEFYRSSVELTEFDVAADLERYFTISEQTTTRVTLETLPQGEDTLGVVGGVLVQPLPDGDRAVADAIGAELRGGLFAKKLAGEDGTPPSASQLLAGLFPDRTDVDLLAVYPVSFGCTCSEERVKRALGAMGKAELEDLLAKEGKAEATCHFCSTQYVIDAEALRGILALASD